MTLALYIKDGPLAGQNFPLTDGATIGRKKSSTIFINDPKASGSHAVLEFSGTDGWYIKDLGSTNKILVGENKIDTLHLEPGVEFVIGKTTFLVVDQKSLLSQPWQELLVLTNYAKTLTKDSNPTPILWFQYPIKLTFQKGSQTGQSWLLEFGPRQVGSKVLDLIIEDELCPDNAFEVSPSEDGPKFTTKYPQAVKLNHSSLSTAILKNNDIISIRYNTIHVELKNG